MKKMKLLKGLTLAALLAVSSVVPSTIFAAETVKVNGYINEGIKKDQIEVSLITKKLDIKTISISDNGKYDMECDSAFMVTPSSVIKTLDEGSSLDVYKIKKEGNTYKIIDTVKLTEGQVKIYEETGEISADGVMQMEEKLVSTKDFDPQSYSEMPLYQPGAGVKLTQPGEYLVVFRYPAMAESTLVYVQVAGKATSEKPQLPQLKPTASKVLVNGKEVAFEAYNINNSNYFKLRDLACALNDCNVTWDAQTQAIAIIPGVPYEATGNELTPGDGKVKEGKETTVKVKKEGQTYTLKGYNINGNNYIKVRDAETLLDMTVGYNQEKNTLTITSN